MEASPFYHHDHRHFLLDQCLSSPNPTTTSTGFFDDFNQHYEQVLPTNSIEVSAHGNQASIGINNLQNSDSSMSTVVHDHKFDKKMPTTNSSFNNADTNDRVKDKRGRKQKKSNADQENKKVTDSKEEGQLGYIYVRAKRGQATDSHSLAERVRREKISEKMKTLQAIVPGCDKITGKALMLDEVINYVQSLQNEIQILSLELASVNPMLNDYGTDFEEFMLKSHQDMTTNQQQLFSFQENQMPCMISQNNGEALWDFEEQGQEQLVNPFAITNFNSF